MKDGDNNGTPKLTEPEPLPFLFVTDFAIQTNEEHITRLIFWTELPAIGDREREARIQARFAMPEKTFRRLISEGRRNGRRTN